LHNTDFGWIDVQFLLLFEEVLGHYYYYYYYFDLCGMFNLFQVLRHKVVTEAGLSKLIFTEDESRLLASSLQGFVFVINVLSGSIAQTFTCHHESILDICFIP
jgi:hypothetical protein